MSRAFDGLAESPASVGQIHAAFGRKDYWLDRLKTNPAATSLDSLSVDPDGTLTVQFTQYLGRQLLPGPVANVIPGDVKLVNVEQWTPDGDNGLRGRVDVSVSGGLGTCRARAWLEPAAANGSRLRVTGSVQVKIPLVGGRLEKAVGANLAQNIPTVMCFTTAWLDEHA
ncbi:DUF2505 domain-containing protein [Mycobacterium sp. Lab-001]|uniref:DUF2505 domain-containing protein n=1 Tax=Mycobacterium sp. Lab-001 TaxID=3410136 RepID=UPI003D16FCDF